MYEKSQLFIFIHTYFGTVILQGPCEHRSIARNETVPVW